MTIWMVHALGWRHRHLARSLSWTVQSYPATCFFSLVGLRSAFTSIVRRLSHASRSMRGRVEDDRFLLLVVEDDHLARVDVEDDRGAVAAAGRVGPHLAALDLLDGLGSVAAGHLAAHLGRQGDVRPSRGRQPAARPPALPKSVACVVYSCQDVPGVSPGFACRGRGAVAPQYTRALGIWHNTDSWSETCPMSETPWREASPAAEYDALQIAR